MFVTHKPWGIVSKEIKKPNWKKTVDPKRLESLSLRQQKKTANAIVRSVYTLRTEIPSALEIADAWSEGGYAEIIDEMDLDEAQDKFESAGGELFATLLASTKIAIGALPEPIQNRYRYDYSNPRIERIWRDRSAQGIVSPIINGTKESIQQIVHTQFTMGLSPKDLAGEIKNYIGLYPRLAKAHTNYVSGLRGSGMSPDRVEALSEKYYDKLLNYRSMMIARTETNLMLNRGQLEVWKQGQENGIISRQARKIWVVDGNPCPDCIAMDGIEVELNEPWVTPDGDIVDVPTEIHPFCECIMTIDYGDIEEADFIESEEEDEQEEED